MVAAMLAFALATLALPSAGACSTAADCGLLGECVSSACVCDAGWTGPTCASLDLLPAPVDAGLRQANSSNWCGTLLRDEADASLFHSYNADFGGCRNGLSIWLTGSRVIHSTGRSPVGPFTPQWAEGGAEVAVAGEAHNPQAIRAPDGTYLLFDSYAGPDAGCPLEANYSTCKSTGPACSHVPKNGGPGVFTFHASSSPAGPWAPVNVSMDFPCFSENLTPSPFFHPNGTLFIVLHCDSDATHRMCDLAMVRSTATSWRGPFARVNDRIWDSSGVAPHPEDPYLFMRTAADGSLSYHVILHNTPRGIHLFSADGFAFALQQSLSGQDPQPPFVFTEVVNQSDGTHFAAARRERPWLLLEPGTSRPQALLTSMQAPDAWPVVFTHAQQVR